MLYALLICDAREFVLLSRDKIFGGAGSVPDFGTLVIRTPEYTVEIRNDCVPLKKPLNLQVSVEAAHPISLS